MNLFTALRASLQFTSFHFTSLPFPSLHFTSLNFTYPINLHFTLLCYSYLHLNSLHFLSLSLPFNVCPFPNPRFENMRFTVVSPCRPTK